MHPCGQTKRKIKIDHNETKRLNDNVRSTHEARPARKKSGVSVCKRTHTFDSVGQLRAVCNTAQNKGLGY